MTRRGAGPDKPMSGQRLRQNPQRGIPPLFLTLSPIPPPQAALKKTPSKTDEKRDIIATDARADETYVKFRFHYVASYQEHQKATTGPTQRSSADVSACPRFPHHTHTIDFFQLRDRNQKSQHLPTRECRPPWNKKLFFGALMLSAPRGFGTNRKCTTGMPSTSRKPPR